MRASKLVLRSALPALLLAGGCGVSDTTADSYAPFMAIYRDVDGQTGSALKQGLGGSFVLTPPRETFYLAINKEELGKKWFLSAYLSQIYPHTFPSAHSLGTRVVSFKVQNGKLFVFDVDDRKKTSDTYDPEVIVEAYPLVTDNEKFNSLPHSKNYVLFDPAAGLNEMNVVADAFSGSQEPNQ